MAEVRIVPSADLSAVEVEATRRMLDAAFDGGFADDDWAHGLGGTHALIVDDDAVTGVLAHASVVARSVSIGGRTVRVGYVEAVGVTPSRRGAGLGSATMRAIADVIEREFELGALSTGEQHFYERLGWERWQGPTWVRHPDGTLERTEDEDDGIMILRVRSNPSIDVTASITCDARPGDAW